MLASRAAASARPRAAAAARQHVRCMGVVRTKDAPERPLSPHVTIYAFPVSAISSVAHRITGLGLTAGFYTIGVTAALGGDAAAVAQTVGSIPVLGALVKAEMAGGMVYHTLLGVRHLYWERFPEQLGIEYQQPLSWGIIGVSSAVGVAAMFV